MYYYTYVRIHSWPARAAWPGRVRAPAADVAVGTECACAQTVLQFWNIHVRMHGGELALESGLDNDKLLDPSLFISSVEYYTLAFSINYSAVHISWLLRLYR